MDTVISIDEFGFFNDGYNMHCHIDDLKGVFIKEEKTLTMAFTGWAQSRPYETPEEAKKVFDMLVQAKRDRMRAKIDDHLESKARYDAQSKIQEASLKELKQINKKDWE